MGNNIDRRQFLTFVASGAAVGLIPFSGCIDESADPIANRVERPNIIFILADDLGRPLELYNLKTDIAEKNNISAEHPEIIAEIEAYLKTARTDAPHWPVMPPKNNK